MPDWPTGDPFCKHTAILQDSSASYQKCRSVATFSTFTFDEVSNHLPVIILFTYNVIYRCLYVSYVFSKNYIWLQVSRLLCPARILVLGHPLQTLHVASCSCWFCTLYFYLFCTFFILSSSVSHMFLAALSTLLLKQGKYPCYGTKKGIILSHFFFLCALPARLAPCYEYHFYYLCLNYLMSINAWKCLQKWLLWIHAHGKIMQLRK